MGGDFPTASFWAFTCTVAGVSCSPEAHMERSLLSHGPTSVLFVLPDEVGLRCACACIWDFGKHVTRVERREDEVPQHPSTGGIPFADLEAYFVSRASRVSGLS